MKHKILGHGYFLMEEWGNIEIWNTLLIKPDRYTSDPVGKITVRLWSPWDGERYYETTPYCVNYYEGEDGTPWAIVVHQITEDGVAGWGAGLPGEYAKWKIHDSQLPFKKFDYTTPGQYDALFLAYECYDPSWGITCDTDGNGEPDSSFDEFWAPNNPPDCTDTDFVDMTLALDGGKLVIR